MEKADVRLAAGGKIPGKAEVDPSKNGIHNITADVLAAHQHHGGIGGEAPQQRLGHKLNDQYYGNAVTGGDHGGVFQGLGGALRLACAKVLGRQRRYRRQHGGRHNEHGADDFFHNAHGGRINQAAVVGNDGDNDERDLNAAVLHSDRQADFKNTAQHAFARAEVLAAQPQAGFVPPDAEQGNNNTQGLRKGSAQRSTHRAKGHGTDEKNIQRNIGGAGNGDKVHRAFGIPQTAEDGADDVVCRDERDADEADGQILHRAGNGLCRNTDQADQRAHCGHQHGGKTEGDRHEQGDGVADGGFGIAHIARPHGVADDDGGTHGKPNNDNGQHVHDLAAVGNGGDAVHPAEPAGDVQVSHAVQRLQKVREQIRQGKGQNDFEHAAGCKIFFHDNFLSSSGNSLGCI